MASRLNYFFRQKVTEAELDLGFTYLEQADRALMTDTGQVGVAVGGVVSERGAGANMSVDITALIAYDKAGQRIQFAGTQNISLANDENGTSTAVASVGNSKILSVFAKFKRNLTDPRTDGNSVTVYFNEAESYEIVVRQGGEGVAPSAPPLDPTYILLADVTRAYGATTIVNANISTARREDAFVLTGAPFSTRQGTAKAAMQALLTRLNSHLSNGTSDHIAGAIAYGGSGNWADASVVAAGTVESALDTIVANLAASAGSDRVGAAAYAPSNGIFSLAAGSVQAQLRALALMWDRPLTLPVGAAITANTAIAANDGKYQLRVNTAGGPVTITLPPPASSAGRRIKISDVAGTFGTNACTVARNAAESIQGLAANRVLTAPWGSYEFWSDGSNWFMS